MNKKTIYQVGTQQNIKYTKFFTKWIYFFIKKIEKTYDEWIIRNVKYIYASSPEEAIKKYQMLFEKKYKSMSGWGDWYKCSDHIYVEMINNPCYKLINQEIIIMREDINPKNIEELKKNMSAYDFRDWWNDYHCGDIIEVLNND